MQNPKTWMTVEVGTHESNAALRAALIKQNIFLSHWAQFIFPEVEISNKREQIELVRFTPEELDLDRSKPLTNEDIVMGAIDQLLLLPCTGEAAVIARMQYKEQPLLECVNFIMNPIYLFQGCRFMFAAKHFKDEVLLATTSGHPVSGRFFDEEFVMMRNS